MFNNKKVTAIIVAAGSGTRMGSDIRKQYMTIAGRTILDTTLYKFEKSNYVDNIILVINKEEYDFVKSNISCGYEKIKHVVIGGETRTQSVYKGIEAVAEDCHILLIHDGVRPFVSHKLINKCVEAAFKYKACIPVLDVFDTIIQIDDDYVEKTLDRKKLKTVQTPQAFEYELIKKCYDNAIHEVDVNFTDDSSVVGFYGHKVKIIEGLPRNMKITTPLDLKIAEIFASIY